MAKLRGKEREAELGEGSLHGQLVKKMSSQQVESYSRWLNVHSKTPSVTNLCECLKKEVAIKMEEQKMAHVLEQKPLGDPPFKRGNGSKPRIFFSEVDKKSNQQDHHAHSVDITVIRYGIASSMRHWSWTNGGKLPLCFRCLSKDHHGKDCHRTGCCGIDGCSLSHHHLLHDPERQKVNAALRLPANVSDPHVREQPVQRGPTPHGRRQMLQKVLTPNGRGHVLMSPQQ